MSECVRGMFERNNSLIFFTIGVTASTTSQRTVSKTLGSSSERSWRPSPRTSSLARTSSPLSLTGVGAADEKRPNARVAKAVMAKKRMTSE